MAGMGLLETLGQFGQPPQGGNGSETINQAIQQQIDAASQPEAVTPQYVPHHSKLWQRILSALADSGSAYAAGQGAGSRTNFTGGLIARDEYGKNVEASNAKAQADSKSKAAQKRAELTFRELLSQRETSDRVAERELARTEAEKVRRDEMTQRTTENAAATTARQKEFEAHKAWDSEMEKARFGHEQAVAGIRAKVTEGDKAAAQDQKNLGEIIGHIGGLADVADVALAGGDPARQIPAMTPKQMATKVRRLMEQMQLGPEARKAAETYFQKEMGPIIKKAELDRKNQAAIDIPTNGPGILDSSPIPMNSALALGR